MSVLVIGGNGFIGRYLVRRLLQTGKAEIVSMDVFPPSAEFLKFLEPYASRFRYIAGNVAQLSDVANAIKTSGANKVVNLAYLLPPASENNIPASVSVNIVGNLNVFEAARLMGVTRVVYASSIGLYGSQSEYGDRELTEDDTPNSKQVYGVGKQFTEMIARRYSEQYGFSTISVRPGFTFGHGRTTGTTAPWFTDLISLPSLGKPVKLEVEGTARFCAIYVEDVAEMMKILLEVPTPKHMIYNTGGYNVTLGEIADVVRELIPAAKITFGKEPWRTSLPWKVSHFRAKEDLGYSIRDFKQAILDHIKRAREEVEIKSL